MERAVCKLLVAIGTCHVLMKHHAHEVRSRPKVTSVTHWINMYNVDDAFRLEEYVDAELSDGSAISWALELTVTEQSIGVEADIRRIHKGGQDVLSEIADCIYSTAIECSNGLPEIVRYLCSSNPL